MSDPADTADAEATRRPASEIPPDILAEREKFVRTFLRKGVEYAEELLHENQDLRDELEQLRHQNARLRAQVASDDAIRDLLRTVERLEEERRELLERENALEEKRRRDEGRRVEVEQEVNDLANLYIASHQLHTSLSVPAVIRQVKDMIGQLVGAERYVVYVREGEDRLVPIAHEPVDADAPEELTLEAGPIGDAVLTGLLRVRDETNLSAGSLDEPLAVIPLRADGQPIGAIAILSLLSQKQEWAGLDRELFNLLGAQAGTALIAANLYADVPGPGAALADLGSKLRS